MILKSGESRVALHFNVNLNLFANTPNFFVSVKINVKNLLDLSLKYTFGQKYGVLRNLIHLTVMSSPRL